ncbi:MAG: type II toxin-antitoxin system Phd/YefM family antitoxin [Anaerolineae bacterium]|nr:type II toxin-antitoxin system Phd/YefM family antitoxin [Anaerolineae bacterium]
MPRTVSASEAKTQFGSIVNWTVERQDDVIVESRGRPRVVIIPYEEYERLLTLREAARRQEALAQLERLRDRVRARNEDLSGQEALSLADRFAREAAREMAEEGRINYQAE